MGNLILGCGPTLDIRSLHEEFHVSCTIKNKIDFKPNVDPGSNYPNYESRKLSILPSVYPG